MQELQQQQHFPATPPNEGDPFQPSTTVDEPPAVVPAIIQTPTPAVTTRSGRVVRPTECSVESQQQRQAGIVAYRVEFEVIDLLLYQEEDRLSAMDDPIDFCAHTASFQHAPNIIANKATSDQTPCICTRL